MFRQALDIDMRNVMTHTKLLKHWKEIIVMQDEWFKTVCKSYSDPPVFVEGEKLPAFPSDTIQANTTGQAGVNTLKEAFIFYLDCVENFKDLGVPISREHTLLDFGVGWGRIARFFLRQMPLSNIYGIDVMDEFIQICRKTFRSDNFHVIQPFPPTDFVDGKFNFVVGYSVFSHLSEKACAKWMREFHRITSPEALVVLTTRGRPFFDYCESLKGKGLTGYPDALSTMFDDFGAARARYDGGEFVHSNRDGVTGGGTMTAEFYGETFIPEQYAKSAYADLFKLEKFVFDPERQTHPIMFFRRK
jgi:2-polyprenyl-3-methyl-5-hydroxy-6-metoxy-1,4-benzoquinol methylase